MFGMKLEPEMFQEASGFVGFWRVFFFFNFFYYYSQFLLINSLGFKEGAGAQSLEGPLPLQPTRSSGSSFHQVLGLPSSGET